MINFKIKDNKIIAKILFDLFYDNSKIYYGNNGCNKEPEIAINSARDKKIKLKIELEDISFSKEFVELLEKEGNDLSLLQKTYLHFSKNNIIDIRLSNDYSFYNENLNGVEIEVNRNGFVIGKEKIQQLKNLLKIRSF